MGLEKITPKGRGSHIAPANRFLAVRTEPDWEQIEGDEEFLAAADHPATEYLPDASQSIVSTNDSPDIPFRYSINPYRGCAHGCSYCYARPSHEYLGLNAGIDFETKILVKHDAANLFRAFLARETWKPEFIVLSGVTDCYQPAERKFRLTRGCLEVALEARQPIGIITKNALVVRDLDLLRPMAEARLIEVGISVTSLDAEFARVMEPRTSSPAARLRAIRELSTAGVPVRIMTAPIIPGLNDTEIPAILAAAKEAGARAANYTLVRLPWAVAPVFREWLERTQPDRAERVLNLIRSTRGGKLNDPNFGSRQRGQGEVALQIKQMFGVFRAKHGLVAPLPDFDYSQFRTPQLPGGQMRLF